MFTIIRLLTKLKCLNNHFKERYTYAGKQVKLFLCLQVFGVCCCYGLLPESGVGVLKQGHQDYLVCFQSGFFYT